jgi:type VI secretion system protein ImpL
MMNTILSLLRQRWLVTLMGVLAIALLIWFVGPLLSIAGIVPLAGVFVRLVLILLLVAGWGLYNLRLQMKQREAEQSLAKDMAAPGASARGNTRLEDEQSALAKRFTEGMAILKKSHGPKGRRHSLLDLPWYVIIGPPGAGKTTALVNSGLRFPLAERFGKEAIAGVGGTRNCDWWFTEEAVLLDTAGRYVTQDSDREVDNAGWTGFLDQLKRHRKRRPINGVLVAISVLDLMTLDGPGRARHMHAIRTRITELNKRLGIRFPVYVLLTKCDLLAGFTEFFDDLGREERAQVWGVTFPYSENPDDGLGRLNSAYDGLVSRLNDRLFWRLSAERDPRRRAIIHGFPAQMASLGDVVGEFLAGIFESSRYDEPLVLRGVYFTSGTQEGAPIDRVMGSVARSFGLEPAAAGAFSGPGRSYFLTRLLHDVVFAEAGLAGTSQRVERRRLWIQRAAYAAAILVTVGLTLTWSGSFAGNLTLLGDVETRIEDYDRISEEPIPAGYAGLPALSARLDAAAGIAAPYAPHRADGVPLRLGFGLYQGRRIGGAAERAYVRMLHAEFLPAIADRLATLVRTAASDLDLAYELLKCYLMLGDPARLDPDNLMLIMRLDFDANWPQDAQLRGRLESHLAAALAAGIPPVALDEQLIRVTRNSLTRMTLSELVYGRLRRDYEASSASGFVPSEELGPAVERVFSRRSGRPLSDGVPALYTRLGFFDGFLDDSRSLVDRIRAESWVLGTEQGELSRAEEEQLTNELDRLYTGDFIAEWEGLLDDLQVRPFNGLADAADRVDLAAGNQSPIAGMLDALARNIRLDAPPEADGEDGAEGGESGAAGGDEDPEAAERLRRLMSGATGQDGIQRRLPGAEIMARFTPLAAIVDAPAGAPAPFDDIAAVLSDLAGALNALSVGGGDPTGAEATAQRLGVLASRQPEPVRTWLQSMAAYSRDGLQGERAAETRDQLSDRFAGDIVRMCALAIEGRFPLVPTAEQSVTLADFARFFGPGGLMAGFFNDALAPYVDRSTEPWQWQTADGVELSFGPEVLEQFELADRVRMAFFGSGPNPETSFVLRPVALGGGLREVRLDIGGQQVTVTAGTDTSSSMRWPSPGGSQTVRVTLVTDDNRELSITEDGPWAWFRLLDRPEVDIAQLSADRFRLAFAPGAARAEFELRAASVINPFMVTGLERFRCLDQL